MEKLTNFNLAGVQRRPLNWRPLSSNHEKKKKRKDSLHVYELRLVTKQVNQI